MRFASRITGFAFAMQPQNAPKPSFFCAIFHKLSPLRTVTLESEGEVGATGVVPAILMGVPGTMCSGLTMLGLMAASSCQRWPSPRFICANFHNESPYFTMTLRGPAAFEKAGAVGAGCIVGRKAANPRSGVGIDSAFANTGAIGASYAAGTRMFGFETANFAFAATDLEVENRGVLGTCLGVGAGTFGFAGAKSVFNFSAVNSVFGNTGAMGVLRDVSSTTFGFGAMNSGLADASTALATGR